jgi:hypothetical protein
MGVRVTGNDVLETAPTLPGNREGSFGSPSTSLRACGAPFATPLRAGRTSGAASEKRARHAVPLRVEPRRRRERRTD